MKKIMILVSIAMCLLMLMACNKVNDKVLPTESIIIDFIPPKIDAKVEILEINGHELTLEVIKSRTHYCKVGDVIKGELKNFDFQYNVYPFKEGDVMNVWSEVDSVTETEVKFDKIYPE